MLKDSSLVGKDPARAGTVTGDEIKVHPTLPCSTPLNIEEEKGILTPKKEGHKATKKETCHGFSAAGYTIRGPRAKRATERALLTNLPEAKTTA